MKDLKDKNYVCLPSDKGTEFRVIPQDTYTQVALDHLSDSNTYQKVARMSAKTMESKVNTTWKNICLQNEFPTFVQKSFLSLNTDLPRSYHLIKTHKTSPDIKIRPIVSNSNGPTQRISWLLASALKPMLRDVPAHLENSFELINYIQSGDLTTNKTLTYPCSLDVVSLYTSIPIQEAITNAINRIQNPILPRSKQDVTDLLTVSLNNMYSLLMAKSSAKRMVSPRVPASQQFWPFSLWTNLKPSHFPRTFLSTLTKDMSTTSTYRQPVKKWQTSSTTQLITYIQN